MMIRKVAMTSFAITLYGQCCWRHVGGQQVVSDVHSCWSIYSLCNNMLLCLLIDGMSILLHISNTFCPTTWRRVMATIDREFNNVTVSLSIHYFAASTSALSLMMAWYHLFIGYSALCIYGFATLTFDPLTLKWYRELQIDLAV